MKNAAEFAQTLIERAKNMKTFKIVRVQPDDFVFNGRVPFDLSIKQDLMTFTVHAVDLSEANAQVDHYLDKSRESDDYL